MTSLLKLLYVLCFIAIFIGCDNSVKDSSVSDVFYKDTELRDSYNTVDISVKDEEEKDISEINETDIYEMGDSKFEDVYYEFDVDQLVDYYVCDCEGKRCGEDDGCGGRCSGYCQEGEACDPETFKCKTIVSIEALDPLASEDGDEGLFIIKKRNTNPLTVHYSIGGTAKNGEDYISLNGTLTIEGESASIKIIPIDDNEVEGNESVVLTILKEEDYVPGPQDSATVTILDNDAGKTYYVSTSGDDSNPGTEDRPFRTIQKAANTAGPGDVVIVKSGEYPEHVKTTKGGNNEQSRIVFRADGMVTMQGFDINHPYITIDGFDITGYDTKYYGHINVFSGGNYCQILNNTIRDGKEGVYGIVMRSSPGANNCIIRGNKIRNLNYMFLDVRGGNHLIENNIFERLNSMDYLRVFGHGHIFRRNIFREGNSIPGTSNHPDWVQTFGDNGDESYDMLFEENWIENLEAQIGQLNSGGMTRGLIKDIRDWVFRRNVFINISHNMNVGLPGAVFEHNTFYRVAYTLGGIYFGGSLTRGETSRAVVRNNVFLASGSTPNVNNDIRGYYYMNGVILSSEVLRIFATDGDDSIAKEIIQDLVSNGYLVNSNGGLTDKARSLSDISQFVISDSYSSYKEKVYDLLIQTATLDIQVRNTTFADYNFVAGAPPEFYPKKIGSCDYGVFTPFLFCEEHGINGGDPLLQDIDNPAGQDGIPFTLDDGLKPLKTSPLCRSGYNAEDIGAYSCDPDKVFAK